MNVTLWRREGLVQACKDLSKDILNVDAQFPLDTLPSMKEFLAYQARERKNTRQLKSTIRGMLVTLLNRLLFDPSNVPQYPNPPYMSGRLINRHL